MFIIVRIPDYVRSICIEKALTYTFFWFGLWEDRHFFPFMKIWDPLHRNFEKKKYGKMFDLKEDTFGIIF